MQLFSFLRAGVLASVVFAATPSRAALFIFESGLSDSATPLSSTVAGLTASFAGSSFADPGAFEISYNSVSGPRPLYATLSGAFLTTSAFSLDTTSPLTITFSAPVTALSLNFAVGGTNGTLSLSTGAGGRAVATASRASSAYAYGEGVLSYAGPAFRAATLTASTSTGFAIDNVNATVPEPASCLLLGTGLAGLMVRRRRRTSRHETRETSA